MLAQENDIGLDKLFAFPLGPVPWPLATGDGMLAKTDKAVMLHKLEENVSFQSVQILKEDIHVLDGNVLLHCLNSIPDTFGEVARHLFNRLPNVSELHFVTYTYKDVSIKAPERLRRGTSGLILINGPSSKVPRNFPKFLSNDQNKKKYFSPH